MVTLGSTITKERSSAALDWNQWAVRRKHDLHQSLQKNMSKFRQTHKKVSEPVFLLGNNSWGIENLYVRSTNCWLEIATICCSGLLILPNNQWQTTLKDQISDKISDQIPTKLLQVFFLLLFHNCQIQSYSSKSLVQKNPDKNQDALLICLQEKCKFPMCTIYCEFLCKTHRQRSHVLQCCEEPESIHSLVQVPPG